MSKCNTPAVYVKYKHANDVPMTIWMPRKSTIDDEIHTYYPIRDATTTSVSSGSKSI
jgi:hypothetical protein